MGYYPCVTGVLTRGPYRVREQCQVGSLTGAVASQRVTEAFEGALGTVGNRAIECKRIRELDCETDGSSRYESRS